MKNRILISIPVLILTGSMLGSNCPSARIEPDLGDFSSYAVEYRVVSLPQATARRAAMRIQLEAANEAAIETNEVAGAIQISPANFDFIDAVLGRNLDKEALAREGYYSLGSLRDGELGLFRTTTEKILPYAAGRTENTIVAVFEDDVVTAIDLNLGFKQALKQVPNDWDLLYLGCNRDLLSDANGVVKSRFLPEDKAEKTSYGNLCAVSGVIRIVGTPWVELTDGCTPGTWAYAVRTSSATKIQDLLRGLYPINLPIDLAYQRLMGEKKIRAYCLDPELVRPNFALPSSIR